MSIRIEQVATPSTPPNRRTRRRLPHNLGDVRRLAAQALLRPGGEPGATRLPRLTRRSTSCLALAVAALAVPTVPSTASAAAPAPAPGVHVRHHLPSHLTFPDPGAVTFQTWATAGWSLTPPHAAVDPRCLTLPHHHRCTPWQFPVTEPMAFSGPVPVDDSRSVVGSFPGSHLSPRVGGDVDGPDTTGTSGGGDSSADVSTTTPGGRADSDVPRWASTGHQRGDSEAMRPRVLPAAASAAPLRTPCLRAAYLVGKDRRMLAHLRPAVDAMGVVVSHRHAACAAMVDHLSQARA
ncbi:hypothetical protein [Catenulispora subtropica]|uniref:Uncharacterized protein n=1 Tax=Catenulispora subtropica TaxID=450798 RepID=A0ABN2T8K6_9ACTN